jgi:hypothetical protein
MLRILAALVLVVAIGCQEEQKGGENVPLDQVPVPVMETAKKELPDIQFNQAWKTPNGNYEVRGKNKNGKTRDVQVKPTGEVVEID